MFRISGIYHPKTKGNLLPKVASNQSGTSGFAVFEIGAGDESRTRDLQLGKLSLYRLSYTRIAFNSSKWGAVAYA